MTSTQGANANYYSPETQVLSSVQRHLRGLTSWDQEMPPRKPPQAAGVFGLDDRTTERCLREILDREIEELKRAYGFVGDNAITTFLIDHRGIRAVLKEGITYLHQFFGAQTIFNLELSREEDGSQTLYAIAVWRGAIQDAVHALSAFEESWWLDHMTPATAELAFTYDIA
jgi:hypothetical protein